MLEITEEQIFDYIKCPLRYDARYNLKIARKNHPSFPELLTRVSNSFLFNLMGGKVLTTGALKSKWDTVCEEHKDLIDMKKCHEGLSLLMKMYLWAENEQLCVSDIHAPFRYRIMNGSPQVAIKGQIAEALIPRKDKSCELLIIDFSRTFPDQAMLDMKLKYTLDWRVYQTLLSGIKIFGIRVHHVKSGNDFYTFRTQEEIQRMDTSFRNVAICIEKKLYYPRETIFCTSCDMKLYCHAWRGQR